MAKRTQRVTRPVGASSRRAGGASPRPTRADDAELLDEERDDEFLDDEREEDDLEDDDEDVEEERAGDEEEDDVGEEFDDDDEEGDEGRATAPRRVRSARDAQRVEQFEQERSRTRYREMAIAVVRGTRGENDATSDVVEIAISSETPVERHDWWDGRYYEVLDHDPSSVDLSYARDGMPFLFEHDSRDQIGLIENVRVDSDKKLRGTVRFSRSARAQEIKQDILDGIRKKISVGYRILREQLDIVDEEKGDTYRAVRWLPMEGSSVSVPADYEVGVGRSARGAAHRSKVTPRAARDAAKEQDVARNTRTGRQGSRVTVQESGAEESRAARILALAKEHNASLDEAETWVRTGKTVTQVRGILLDRYRSGETPTTPKPNVGGVQLTDKERKRFSMGRAVLAMLHRDHSRAGFEREVSNEIAKKLGRDTLGFYIPSSLQVSARAMDMLRQAELQQRAVQATNVSAQGGALVYPEYKGLVDLLKNRVMLLKLGAQMHTGLQGTYSYVRKTGASSAFWLGENPGAGVTESDLDFGLVNHNPKTLKATLRYTLQQMAQGIETIDALIEKDVVAEHSIAMDVAGIAADGTANNPIGILNYSGVSVLALGANGAAPTYNSLIDLKTRINKNNATDLGTQATLTTPEAIGMFEKMQKFAGTNGDPVYSDGKMMGFRAESTGNVPSNLVKGTSGAVCHAIIHGIFSELAFLEWGAFEFLVNPYTEDTKGIVRVTSNQFIDCTIEQPGAFAVNKDALIS